HHEGIEPPSQEPESCVISTTLMVQNYLIYLSELLEKKQGEIIMIFEQQFSQQQKKTQTLAMTQKLKQSIQVLQYNAEELTEVIDNKSLENPLLEVTQPTYSATYSKPRKNTGEEINYLSQIPDNAISLFEHLIDQIHLNYRATYLRTLVLY